MPQITTSESFNIFNVVVTILLGVIASYITFIVRSIRKEAQLQIKNIDNVYSKQIEACNYKWSETKSNIGDLLTRARILGTLEERLHAGAEQFQEIKRRLEDIEFIIYKKWRR